MLPPLDAQMQTLHSLLRDIPDYPKPGILFRDITPILENAEAFQILINKLKDLSFSFQFDKVVGIESRGFILASALAFSLRKGLVLVRKVGKLPSKTFTQTYDLEYGTDEIQIHTDSVKSGERVLIVDDVLATGGTLKGAIDLCRQCQAEVAGVLLFLELDFLKGRQKLDAVSGVRVESLVHL